MKKFKCKIKNETNHESFTSDTKNIGPFVFCPQNEEKLVVILVYFTFKRSYTSAFRQVSKFTSICKLLVKLNGELE